VLAGLIKKIDRSVAVFSVEDESGLEAALEGIAAHRDRPIAGREA